MSLFFRTASPGEKRSISYQDVWGSGGEWPGSGTSAGENINSDSAMRVAALWSSADLIASIVSTMPIDTFSGNVARPVSPQPKLVSSPSRVVSRREWTYQALMSLMLRGNAVGLVVTRDALLRPETVEWLDPSAVTIQQKSSLELPTYSIGGQDVPRGDIVHLRAFLRPGSAIGMSLIEYHKEMLGTSTAALKYGGQWYGGGAHPTALLFNKEKTLDPGQAKTVKDRFLAVVKGNREPLVLGKDWAYEPIQSTASD
ncbi:MAG: phage portal protein, partial [Gammaproteobacteria bacterium]